MYWNNIYLWPMIAAGLIALGVCLYIWPRRQAVGAGLLMAMILAVAEWSFAYALEYGWPTLTLKAIAVKLEYIGITAIPPLWLAFTLRYTGKERWVTGRNVLLLAIFPALTLLFVWTNEYHGLLWSRVWLVATESFPRLAFRRGVWFWVWTGLAYLQLAAGSIILVVANLRTPKLYRKQIGIVLLGALFPWLSNAIYLGGLSPVPFLDLTPFAFTLTGLLWTWSLFRYRLMDLAPIAHQVVIEGLSEAVIVLDHLDRLVDANLKARELMNLPEAEAVGRPIQELIPETTHLLKGELPIRDVVAELDSGPDRERRWYEIRVSGLTDTRLRPVGKVIILYDITNLKETENALKASEERYRLTVDKSQSGIVLIDDASRIIYANPEFGRIVGYSPEEVLNRNFQDFLAEESREMTAERYRDRQAGRAVPDRYTIRLVRRDGVKRTIELSAVVFRETTGRVQSMAQLMDVTERETAMTALQESENRYRTIFEQSRDVIYLSRPDGEVVEFNQAAVDLLGYTREEYLLLGDGKAYLDPEQRVRQMAELEEKGFIKDYEIGLRCRDGSEIVCLDTATVWRDEEGRIKGYIGTLRDVTESKMAEQALRESEERYQRILEASQDPMVLCGMDQRVIYLNPSFTRIFGWTMEELRGRRSDFVPERYLQETLEMGAEVDRGESFSGFETRRYNKAGRLVDISLSAAVFRDREGNPLGSVINLRDVTRRKRAEEAVRESEEKFRNITSNALDGIIMVDPAGLISFWNEAAERMFGYSGQEVLGRDLHLLLAPEKYHDRYREAFQSFQAEGRGRSVGRTLELTALKKGGEEIPIEISISSLWSRDQWHALGVVRDIGERKRAEAERERLEAQLRQAQKMEAVGNLASGVAHDFNNLLQGIGGYSQLIMALKEIDEKALHYAAEIDGAAQRATDLVTRLLTFGRKVEPELKPVDLNGLVLQGGEFLKRTIPRMIKIETRLARDLQSIEADANQLNQVLMNLGANARDAMPEGGRLLFETENVVLDENQAADNLLPPGAYVRLKVSDNGVGISEAGQKRIFEPFYTTKDVGKGSGLGLSMVYGIINSHGGNISCTSRPGEGTTFRAYFPVLAAEPIEPAVDREVKGDLPGGNETVLVVDDESAIQETAGEILRQQGYEVLIAGSGEEALEIYRAKGGMISLVLMDLSMPGMGGRKAMTELLRMDPQVKVLISSGYSSRRQVEECLASGAAGFIGKPYRIVSLLKDIRRVLDG